MKARCLHCRKIFDAMHASTNLCSDDCRRTHMRRYQARYRELRGSTPLVENPLPERARAELVKSMKG